MRGSSVLILEINDRPASPAGSDLPYGEAGSTEVTTSPVMGLCRGGVCIGRDCEKEPGETGAGDQSGKETDRLYGINKAGIVVILHRSALLRAHFVRKAGPVPNRGRKSSLWRGAPAGNPACRAENNLHSSALPPLRNARTLAREPTPPGTDPSPRFIRNETPTEEARSTGSALPGPGSHGWDLVKQAVEATTLQRAIKQFTIWLTR